jgi:hypothetical protein
MRIIVSAIGGFRKKVVKKKKFILETLCGSRPMKHIGMGFIYRCDESHCNSGKVNGKVVHGLENVNK